MTFLIVDDSKIARKKLSSFIENLGHQVLADAGDGAEAIEKFEKYRPDCITMDLEMPKMKGDAAAKKILEIDESVKILLITSIVDKKEVLKSLKLGVYKVLQKPISQSDFAEAITEL
jgi:two-component system chemotaxis response regulator CheY